MAERRPPGFNVPLGFYDGPEVNSIPRRIRAAAVGVWTLCGTFSANKLQDGYVGPEMLKQLGCTDAIRAALKATRGPDGEPDPLWIDARDGGIQFTKWHIYQRSRAEVKAYRKAEAERKRAEREAKKHAAGRGDGKTSGRTSAGHPPDHRDPKTKTETEISNFVPDTEGGPGGERPNHSVAAKAAPANASENKRGTRLPDNWIPSEATIAAMREEFPNVDLRAVHTEFCDYWRAVPGAKGRKLDWDATWRNRVREVASRQRPRLVPSPSATGPPGAISAGEAKVRGWAALGGHTDPDPDEPKAIQR